MYLYLSSFYLANSFLLAKNIIVLEDEETQKLGSREALLLHTHRWIMTTQKERLMAQPLSLTSPLTRVRWGWARGRRRERRGKEDLSWFDVTIYQGTGECDGWERNGGSAGNSGRERELMCGFVCSSRRLVKWTVILAFNFPSAFSRKNRREERSTREESRRKENEEIHIFYWQTQHNHCHCT